MNLNVCLAAGFLVFAPIANGGAAPAQAPPSRVVPIVDHHTHVVSAEAAAGSYPAPVKEVELPKDLADLLAQRQRVWNDPAGLAHLYTENAAVLNTDNPDLPSWITGRSGVAQHVGTLFGRPHRIKPVTYRQNGRGAYIAGYFHRPDVDRHFGHVLLSLVRGDDGRWRIAAEAPVFPGPPSMQSFSARELVADLDSAEITRAVVLSVAYWFGSEFRSRDAGDEYARVRAENDWVAEQVALYPDRLVSFCSVNPLRPYALDEVRRCGVQGRHRGLKLHFGNSGVDIRQRADAEAVSRIFAEANRQRLPIVVHLWTDPSFETEGAAHAQAFLEHVLPSAPDVVVQVAHMAGGGRMTETALNVFAESIAARDPRARHLYFDVATLTGGETPENLQIVAAQMRKLGLQRILFGSDASGPSRPVWQAWPQIHAVPLTQEEFRQLAQNVAPYLK